MSKDLENPHFDQHRKHQGLTFEEHLDEEQDLSSGTVDRSRKGSVDERILLLVQLINSSKDLYTSSSCSGRAILFTHQNEANQQEGQDVTANTILTKGQKKGCKWLYVTHDEVVLSEFISSWKEVPENTEVNFKVESCILHVQCRLLSDAEKLIHVATESGFRNSGMVISGKNKITVAVRSAISMEVPFLKTSFENMESYLEYVIGKANEKLQENWQRTKKFTMLYQKYFGTDELPGAENN